MSVSGIILLGVLGLLLWGMAACFRAARIVWAGQGADTENLALRFSHDFALLGLLLVLFSFPTEWYIQLSAIAFLLLTAEFWPAVYARRHEDRLRYRLTPLVEAVRWLFFPLTRRLTRIDTVLEQKAEENEKSFSIEQVSSALEAVSQAQNTVQEVKILQGIVQFSELEASAIMTPRVNMVCVPASARFDELMRLIRETAYSRMPVYQESLDKIIGVLYIKDLLPHLQAAPDFDWRKLVRPALFTSETEKIDALMRDLQARRVHMAIVTDEYGGTSGLVTLEDILEEVVGDISDEFDEGGEEALYRKLSDRTYLFDARMPIHDFCRLMNLKEEFFEDYEGGEYETLAGFVLERLGRFPRRDEKVSAGAYDFTVEAVDRRRIKRIKMTVRDED
ncbi:MAG: CBS domain-containing protein [Bacteroidales bacterium]|nr:CBS domain-containing protein [Bacteroidales bacterium]